MPGPWVNITGVSSPYTIADLANGTEYDVQVRAVNADGRLGTWSDESSATPVGAQLELTDFDDDGLDVRVLAVVVAGAAESNGTVYRSAANGGPLGSVLTGSDVEIQTGQSVTRIALNSGSIGQVRLWDNPSPLDWSTFFTANPDLTMRLQFAPDGPAYEFTRGNQSTNRSIWTTTSTAAATDMTTVATGDRFILAIAQPAPPSVQSVATTFSGAAGSLVATVTKSAPAAQSVAATLVGGAATFTAIVTKAAPSAQPVAVTFSGAAATLTATVTKSAPPSTQSVAATFSSAVAALTATVTKAAPPSTQSVEATLSGGAGSLAATVTKSAAPSAQSIAVTLVGGAATFTATVTNADEAPSFTDNTGDAQDWTVGTAITSVTVPEADGTPAPSYAVEGSLPAGIAFNTTTRVLSGTPTATGSGTITIRASNSAGDADWTVAYTTAAAATAPARPAVVMLTVDGHDQITAVGVDPDDGGSPITSYTWRYRINATPVQWVERIGETSLTQVFDGLDAATQYRIQFRAVNNVGSSPRSPAAFATTDAAPSEQPVAATLVGAAGSLAATVTKSTPPATQPVAVTFSGVVATLTTIVTKSAALSVQSVAVTFSGGSSILTAEVRIEMAGSWMEAIGVTSPYTIYNLTNGVEYEVQVRANNDEGGTWSDIAMGTPISGATLVVIQALAPTETVTVVVPVPPGRVPLGAVRSGNNELTVTWEAPDEEGTNGIDYYDMRIRSAAPSSSPEEVEEWTVLDRVAPDDREHTIKGLANHFEFEVQVRAVSVNLTTDNRELALKGLWSEGGVGIPEPEREAAQGVVRIVTWDDRIWGITSDGRIMDTFDLANSWTERAAIPLHYSPVTDAFIFNDVRGEPAIYIMTETGMWLYDVENERVLQTDVTYPQAPERGQGTVVWQSSVYIPIGNGIWRWSGGSSPVLDLVGPDRDSGLPWDGESRIVKLVGSTNHLIAAVQNTDFRVAPEGTSHILAYNGIGWQVLWSADPDDGTVVLNDVFVAEILGEYSLWLGHQDLAVIDLPIDIVNPARLNWRRRYASEGYLITPWFDANEVELDKLAIEWKADASQLSATETFLLEYGVDFQEDTWHEIITIPTQERLDDGTPNGYYRVQIPDIDDEDPTGFLWKSIRFRVTAASANAELTPDLHMVGLEFKPRLDTVWGFSVPVNLNEGTGNRNPRQLREELTKALSDKKMVKLEFGGDTFYAELESGDLTQIAGSAEDGDAPATALQFRELRQAE